MRTPRYALIVPIILAALCAGCVVNGRQILLKEYGPSVPVAADLPLQRITISLGELTSAPDLVALELQAQPDEPNPFQYVALTPDQKKLWNQDRQALQQKHAKSLPRIGNMRNVLGIVMSHVYALNDPSGWLLDSLRYDLRAQGATVVAASSASSADVQLSGTIQLLRADMYFEIGSSLVVDMDLKTREGESLHHRFFTHGSAAYSPFGPFALDYFETFRIARQKFSILLVREILQTSAPRYTQ